MAGIRNIVIGNGFSLQWQIYKTTDNNGTQVPVELDNVTDLAVYYGYHSNGATIKCTDYSLVENTDASGKKNIIQLNFTGASSEGLTQVGALDLKLVFKEDSGRTKTVGEGDDATTETIYNIRTITDENVVKFVKSSEAARANNLQQGLIDDYGVDAGIVVYTGSYKFTVVESAAGILTNDPDYSGTDKEEKIYSAEAVDSKLAELSSKCDGIEYTETAWEALSEDEQATAIASAKTDGKILYVLED